MGWAFEQQWVEDGKLQSAGPIRRRAGRRPAATTATPAPSRAASTSVYAVRRLLPNILKIRIICLIPVDFTLYRFVWVPYTSQVLRQLQYIGADLIWVSCSFQYRDKDSRLMFSRRSPLYGVCSACDQRNVRRQCLRHHVCGRLLPAVKRHLCGDQSR